jgi:thiamine transport system substrate-binding protein
MANPKNLIRFVPAEGLDADHAPIPVFQRQKEARVMRKSSLFSAAACGGIPVHSLSPPSAPTGQLTIYTYDSFVAEWGPGPKIEAAFEADCDATSNGSASPMAWRF